MKALLILLVLSCTTSTEVNKKFDYKFIVSGSIYEMNAIIKKDEGERLVILGEDSIVMKGTFRDSLKVWSFSPPLNKAVRLRIWIYGNLKYDKWSDTHGMQVHRGVE